VAIAWQYKPPAVNALPVIRAAAETAVDAAAHLVLDESQNLVPVDSGALHDSGQVIRDGLTATISYGQADQAGRDGRDTADYAAIVHERMDVQHPHGQAKYLETAMHGKAADAAEMIAGAIRQAIER
jgi:hypothetical protein